MAQTDLDVPVDADAATDRDSWLALIDQIGEEEGYFQTVGPRHWAMFVDDSPTLIVSFETIAQARARPGQMPLAHHIAASKGWSHLCLISDGQTWFRDPAVYAYFDRLVDDAFFEDFDRVLFYGAGPSAYAACAYCVTAPGAQVLALNPVATLDPAQTIWDDRYRADRKLDFASRYGYAPDMVDGCAQLSLIYDPVSKPDAMHAALFHAPFTTALRARFGGAALESVLSRLNILDQVIIQAAEATLTPASFAALWRKRRDDAAFLKYLLLEVEAKGHKNRAIMLCRNVAKRLKLNRFRKRLSELTETVKVKA
jgi:hypothetical protein